MRRYNQDVGRLFACMNTGHVAMNKGESYFNWYWLLEDPARLSITWAVAVVSSCILFPIWPPLALIALLATFVVGKIVQLRGADFLVSLGSEKTDPPKLFVEFWWCILFIEAAVSVALCVLQAMQEGGVRLWI